MYEQYENKLKQIRNWFHRFRFVILAVILVILGTVLYIKGVGVVYSELSVKKQYTYGETLEPSVSASVKKIVYRYRDAENPDSAWTEEVPKNVGHYEVKAEIISLFGISKDAGTKKFYIVPKHLKVNLTDQTFDDSIVNHKADYSCCDFSGLEYNDRVSEDISFSYIPISDLQMVYEISEPPAIFHEDGSDASDCYTFQSGTASILDSHVMLTIQTGSNIKTYSGNPNEEVKCESVSVVSGSLREGDTIQVKKYPTKLNYVSWTIVPNVISEDDVVITDASGNDVTDRYILTIEYGELALFPIDIIFSSESAEKFYDGTPLTCHEYHLKGTLAPGDFLDIIFTGTITEPGSVSNTYSLRIKSEKYYDVTSCYSIDDYKGSLTVKSTDKEESVLMFDGESEDSFSLMNEGLSESHELAHEAMFQFMGNTSQMYYFRKESYDVYTGSGWQVSDNSKALLEASCFEAGRSLERAKSSMNYISLRNMRFQYGLLPYYSIDNATQKSNVLTYPAYNWNGKYPLQIEEDELAVSIRNDAYANYMSVPANVQSVLLSLGQNAGISPDDPKLIEEIAEYIQNAAKYNLHFSRFPENEDMVIYFLTKGKEGICQHYASAATLMYRSYGIPARYVIGYADYGNQNQWTEMYSDCGHAWVEVYFDNFGWVPVEVTGPDESSEGVPTQFGNSWFDSIIPDPEVTERDFLHIEFSKFEKEYDGLPVTFMPEQRIAAGDLMHGDRLETTAFEIEVSEYEIGITEGSVIYQIFDKSGNDVTDQYIIYCDSPYVKISERYIEITTFGKTGQYDDGTMENNQWYISKGSLANGDSISVKLYTSQDETGTTINIPKEVIITNIDGVDVTSYYNIQFRYGDLTKKEKKQNG